MSVHIEWFHASETTVNFARPRAEMPDGNIVTGEAGAICIEADDVVMVEGSLAALHAFAGRVYAAVAHLDPSLDTSSSGARQYFIDTGRYPTVEEQAEFEPFSESAAKEDRRNEAMLGAETLYEHGAGCPWPEGACTDV